MMYVVIIVILLMLAAISAAYSYMLKRDITEIGTTLSQIRDMDTNLKLTTATFDKDISELAQTINGILEKQKELRLKNESTNRELRKAITNISHDLRTPLTSVMGYLQMLSSDKTPDNKKAEYLAIIEPRLKALSVLMEELFEFSKIVEGHTELNMEKVNIGNLITDVISTFYDDFMGKKMEPQIDLPVRPVYAYCDVKALIRILQNLIKNALVHGSGKFGVSLQPESSVIVIENSVDDMENLDVDRLFERFYTSDASRTNKNTGLGLAIAKELTEQMNGEIMAQVREDILIIKIILQPVSLS